MSLSIRIATEDDLDDLFRLYFSLRAEGESPSRSRLAETFPKFHTYPDYKVYLALEGGHVVGTFALLIADALGARCAPEAIVEDVVVAQEARGRGIGRAMMEFAMQKARAAGCYKMVLSSNLRRTGAHDFYETLGFKKHGYSFAVELESD